MRFHLKSNKRYTKFTGKKAMQLHGFFILTLGKIFISIFDM